MENGAAKGDIKLGPRGPVIGEIAGRLSGGFMSGWTYPYSSGVLPTKGALEIALGRRPSALRPEWNWVCAERAFISIPGRIDSIEGIEKAKVKPWVKDVFLLAGPKSAVKFPENNVSKCGNVLSAAPKREEAVYSAEAAARSILLRLEAPNRETDAFLASGGAFPPNAFDGDPRGKAGCLDYMGRSLEESLEAVKLLSGRAIESREADSSFWQALIRGGYQGAVYYIDSLRGKNA